MTNNTNPLKNLLRSATDPLKQGPNAGRELASRFSQAADGFSREHVLDAAWTVILDVIRQDIPDRQKAHAKLSELVEKMHNILNQHYDPVTGKRRHIFAHDQIVQMIFTDDRKSSK